ncbi:pilus assembly protein N-terminal domain-containing protein [Marinobacter sp. SS21]|uniref:pilus assembly protein N-terminal domain-containing protein n=1 Tax=Marinobacter sp. SS21 TaxID=2979460 RepID=UPI00232DDEC0|nr:pilus assembly protein N-terminal domain-containing protein [Marinobacter sp. SS21]MDC0662277.1 pilus assembly protein N-terminal domain-containing protein [Marinobacter sp. SS21]
MRQLIRLIGSYLLVATFGVGTASAGASLKYVEDANGRHSANHRELIQWTHSRLVFDRDLERVAVGQDRTLEVEVLNGRELLMLAKNVGRTTLMVWYAGGDSETYLFSVTEDLSVLRSALSDIHSAIRIDSAPDRPALVLRGRVPTIDYKVAAETAARHYLGARSGPRAGGNRVLAGSVDSSSLHLQSAVAGAMDPSFRLNPGNVPNDNRIAVINLIRVDTLPLSLEQKVASAIKDLGGQNVRVRRVIRGEVADDTRDTLILEGEVQDQVTLTRVLSVVSRLLPNADTASGDADVVAMTDEAGGLLDARTASRQRSGQFGGLSQLQNGGDSFNNVRANIARSKLVSLANGRILAMLDVLDLPQVRISVQIHEVNRTRMLRWRPDLSVVTNGYSDAGLFALGGLGTLTADSSLVENALQILGGTLTNNLQVGGSDLAFDLLFSLMEQEGIARTLSQPTLTVLAGEQAVFSVGGEVPVPTAFAPTGLKSGDEVATNTPGVFSGTSFKTFGVELIVRAMVDENDRITLDVHPTISAPDTSLTQLISDSTGSALNSTAFNTRSIATTTRLGDGQPLILGGLIYQDQSAQNSQTPGLHRVPLLGRLAEATANSEQDRELVIVVTPTLVRESDSRVHQWAFPTPLDLVRRALPTKQDG